VAVVGCGNIAAMDRQVLDALMLDALLGVPLDALLGMMGDSEMVTRGGAGDCFEMTMTMLVLTMHRDNVSSRSC